MTDNPHPLSRVIPIHHAGFTDLHGETWHWDPFTQRWSNESGDDIDPHELLTEISSLRDKLAQVYAFVRGLKRVLTFTVPPDFPLR